MPLPVADPLPFPDLEAELIRWMKLQPLNAGVFFGTSLPANLDQRLPFTMFTRIPGGYRPNLVMDAARVDVDVRARTREQSHDVMQNVLALLEVIHQHEHNGMVIYRADIESGAGWLPDPITNQPRWIATTSIRYRPN